MRVRAQIVHAGLEVLVDLPRGVQEGGLHVLPRLRRSLQEEQAVLPGKPCTLLVHDLPLLQVALVPDQDDHHVWLRVLPRIQQPLREVLERGPSAYVVDEQRARGAPVVRPRDGAKGLLPRRVPDLELDPLVVDVADAVPEFHADGHVVLGAKPLVCELQEEARLPHTGITHDDVLEEVIVVCRHSHVHGGWSAVLAHGTPNGNTCLAEGGGLSRKAP
mmetsp:Transcript_75743/g.201232  ORF Transcript_75743/g.201232 Transcript_75743/m.201232 type:complete len:218 (-) Transcript_75743:4-657(-)